jgi:hypothetical protein
MHSVDAMGRPSRDGNDPLFMQKEYKLHCIINIMNYYHNFDSKME